MKRLRVMVLMHEDLVPPQTLDGLDPKERELVKTEFEVVQALRDARHEVFQLGVYDEISPIRQSIKDWKPDVVFNLMEEFHGECVYDQHVVSYLELMRQPYTGCNPRGLTIARDKALSKKVLAYHRVPVPKFFVFPLGRKLKRPKHLGFPLIVKSLIHEASTGIAQASVVDSDEKLMERVRFVHERLEADAIVEQYIDGREFYVGVMGNDRLQVLPAWEITLENMPNNKIATEKVKWDPAYQKKHGITWQQADIEPEIGAKLKKLSKRIHRRLGLSGYARLDYRVNERGQPYLLEANPNPQIAKEDEFASSAQAVGLEYPKLIDKLLRYGMRRATRG